MNDHRKSQAKRNGSKSNGPKTEGGKEKCREAAKKAAENRRKTANSTTLPGESLEAFEAHRAALHAKFQPADEFECQMVDELASINWIIRREYFGRTAELVQAYDAAARHAAVGTTQRDLVAAAELQGASPSSNQPAFDRSIQCHVVMRSRIINTLLKLKRHVKNDPRVQTSLDSKDLPSDPPDPPDPSLLDTGLLTGAAPEAAAPAVSALGVPAAEPVAEAAGDTPEEPGDILAWARQNFGFHADKHQAQLLTATSGRTLVLGARQTGKSTAAALKVLHTAVHSPNRQILLAAPSNRQSGQIMQKARAAAHQLFGKRVKAVAEGFQLPNGTQILALPDSETTVRGFSNPALIVVDEAAFVDDSLYSALLPAQATGGANLILLSTPNGQSGFFYEQWADKKASWNRIKVDVGDCDRINPQWLAEMRLTLGEQNFRQEFHCEFLQAPGSIFTREMVANCLRANVQPLFPLDEQVVW